MASKPDLPSDETGQVIASTQHSVPMGDVAAPKSILSDNLEVNGENNQLGASSSHDSLSRNTQSKVTLTSSATHDASTGIGMLPKASSSAIVEDQLTSKGDQRPIGERCKSSEEKCDKNLSVNVVNEARIEGGQCYDKPSSVIDSSVVSPRINADRSVGSDLNIKVKTEKDCGQLQGKILECSDDDEKVGKSKKLAECIDMKNPPVHSPFSDENEDSDIVEQDVKVCDICGDAGREDLLAVCSRCSDGAEHTYCMQDMREKVPEGDWLCEECKMAEENESQKQEIEGKRTNKSYFGTRGSGKRPLEDVEVAPVSKKQAMEAGKGLSPSKVGVLSRDNSFKHTDKAKVRLSHQASSVKYISKVSSDGGCPSVGPQINPPNGKLSKSSSFNTNSKPKVKLMDEAFNKPKSTREHKFPDKEGRVRAMGKSMSFKSANTDRLNSVEPKVKSLSSKYVHDLRGLKSAKEHNSFDRKKLSRLDRTLSGSSKSSVSVSACKNEQKLTPRGETALHSSASNNRGSKFVQSDSKSFALKSTSQMARKGSDTVTTPVGASSTSGFSASADKRLNNNNQDEPSPSSSWNSDRIVNNGDRKMNDRLFRSRESSQVDKSSRENTLGRSKQSGTSSGTIACQRCKDVGHDAESCSLSTPLASSCDTATVRSSGEDLNGNKLKAAITAAMLKKPGIYRRRQLEKSNELATSNVEMKSAAPSHDQLSPHELLSIDVQETRKVSQGGSLETHKVVNINNAKQLAGQPAEVTLSSKRTDSDSVIYSNGKPVMRDGHLHKLAVPLVNLKMSTIPEHEYIWQGAFQVCKGGKFPELCDGIQAHLSTSASPKVVEAVNKFPQNILFDEISRLSTWPSQFNANGVRDDNIALYFFAKDIESYERNYKNLLENMIKNDLALKGEWNGVELLIFPSNCLPQNSQRWNMLYFLWGVFRRRVIGVDETSDAKNLRIPSGNVVHLVDKKLPAASLSYSENVSSLKSKDKNLPHDMAVNVVLARETFSSAQRPILSSSAVIEKGCSDSKTSSTNHKNKSLEVILRQQDNMSGTPSLPEFLGGSVQSCTKIERTKKAMVENSFQEDRRDAQFQQSVDPPGTSDSNRLKEMVHHKMHDVKDSSCQPVKIFHLDSGGDIGAERGAADDKLMDFNKDRENFHTGAMDKDLRLEDPENKHNKRKYLQTVFKEPILQTSAGTNQTGEWKDGNDAVVEGQSAGKKPRSEIFGTSGFNSFRPTGTAPCDQVSTYSTMDKLGEANEVKRASKEFGATERHFFPVDSALGGLKLQDDSMPRKLCEPENGRFLGGFPNLELALGADIQTPVMGIQPLVTGVPDDRSKDISQDNVLPREEEDVSASLSLSLSFPFPDGEQAVKPITRAEQTLPERHHVNTSLLLFGSPQEKS